MQKLRKGQVACEWQQKNSLKISDWVESKINGEFSEVQYNTESSEATITLEKHGKRSSVKRRIELKKEIMICPDCSRKCGGYFEAVIQLRGHENKIERYKNIFEKMLKKKTFIAKESEMHGGMDLYIGNSKAVVEMFSELGMKAIISRKLTGKKDGKRIYRTTFSLRFE